MVDMPAATDDFSNFREIRLFPEIRRATPANNWEIAHYHDTLEFNLVVAGRGAYFLEAAHYDLSPGTLVWLLPFQRHRLLRSPDLDMWVGLPGADHYTPEMLADVARHPIKRLAAEDAVSLDRLFSHLSQDTESPDVHAAGMQYAVRSVIQVARTSAGPPPPVLHPAVTQALAVLRTDDEVANLAALAARCRISADYLGDLLASQTGRGFVEWRNIGRLDRFQNFYPESNDLLTAALAAGFGSYTQFHRVFQDMIGVTPGHWARQRPDSGAISLPRMSQSKDQMSPGSQRLLWCNLGAASFAASTRWLGALLKGGVTSPPDGSGAGGAIPSGCDDIHELQPLLPNLLDELTRDFPELSPRIRAVFGENDILQQFIDTLTTIGGDHRDLSNLATFALFGQSLIANWAMIPTQAESGRLLDFVRHRASQPGGAFDPAQRQEIAAGLIVLAVIRRHAWVGARSSASEAVARRLSDAVHAGAIESLGVDLRQVPLYGPRSPLAVEATAA
jgi:AraC-like DNA-binding protein